MTSPVYHRHNLTSACQRMPDVSRAWSQEQNVLRSELLEVIPFVRDFDAADVLSFAALALMERGVSRHEAKRGVLACWLSVA